MSRIHAEESHRLFFGNGFFFSPGAVVLGGSTRKEEEAAVVVLLLVVEDGAAVGDQLTTADGGEICCGSYSPTEGEMAAGGGSNAYRPQYSKRAPHLLRGTLSTPPLPPSKAPPLRSERTVDSS